MRISGAARQVVRFSGFEFEPDSGELRSGVEAVRVRLEPQPAKVLACLLERAGHVVTRDELRRRVWPADTFVDFERGLTYCIARIRSSLGDSASAPRFIETLPRRGYRFIGTLDAADVAPEPRVDPVKRTRPEANWTGRALSIAAALIIAAAGLWATLTVRGTTGHEPPRLAVVPFDNETSWPEGDRVAGRLTDAVVARLANDPARLGIIGNAAILRRPRATRDLKLIGQTLDVQYAILGQVQQDGDAFRVITHLIRTSDQTHLWAWRFESSRQDIAGLETRVVDTVASAVAERAARR